MHISPSSAYSSHRTPVQSSPLTFHIADSITVLQQQLQRVQALKGGYSQLHNCFLQHVSSLTREQRLEPPAKRAKARSAAVLDTDKQEKPSGVHQQRPDTGPIISPQSCTEGPQSEETRSNLLKALTQRLEDLPSMSKLEQSAASSVALDQDRLDACAVLTGRKARYYVHQTTVSVGRTSVQRGVVRYPSIFRAVHEFLSHNNMWCYQGTCCACLKQQASTSACSLILAKGFVDEEQSYCMIYFCLTVQCVVLAGLVAGVAVAVCLGSAVSCDPTALCPSLGNFAVCHAGRHRSYAGGRGDKIV